MNGSPLQRRLDILGRILADDELRAGNLASDLVYGMTRLGDGLAHDEAKAMALSRKFSDTYDAEQFVDDWRAQRRAEAARAEADLWAQCKSRVRSRAAKTGGAQ